ncbi:hypothetical protein C8Q80DRAFT_889499 [Daedaleopsis nitida]|nr:hypothetical protein C8Q80DRAFT_889499 [Daedaleopsis nitida]
MSQTALQEVCYYLSETIPVERRDKLSELLDDRGATPVSITDPDLTHFITPSLALEDFVESIPDDSEACIVTPRWVERSAVLGSPQPPEYYSADPAYLFSGVTATATDLPQTDCELMAAAIAALGGQWRGALTRDVTHLFALAPGSTKYQTAMHYKDSTSVCVLVPHWFDDTVRLGIRDLPTRNYEWPEPRVFQPRPEGRTPQEDVEYEPPPERMVLYDTASLSNDAQEKLEPASRNIWKGKRLLLGVTLDLSDAHRKALNADIKRQGGQVVNMSFSKSASAEERAREELEKLDEADVFVTRYRSGASYAKAYQQKKTIGTLAWLWYVRASGVLTRPADQLLHYPTPDHPADGFDKEVVTVTNYTGKDREYLKKLIILMGGEFTASMAAEKNTVVVAAFLHGTKTDKATSWSIPIVNHTWVEDCFVQWRRLTPARDKYINFPPGMDFSVVLAERGHGKITWEPGQLEEMLRVTSEAKAGSPRKRPKSKSASASPKKTARRLVDEDADEPLPGTALSAGEVEEAVAMDDDDQMDVDGEVRRHDDMDVDNEAGPSKVPTTKRGPPSKRAKAVQEEAVPKRKLVRRYTQQRKTDDESEGPAATPMRDAPTTPSPKRPQRTYESAKKRLHREQREREEKRAESSSPVKNLRSTRRKAPAEDEDVEMEDKASEDEAPKAKGKSKVEKKPPTRTGKEKEKEHLAAATKKMKIIELESSDSDSDSTEDSRSILADLLQNRKSTATRVAAAPVTKPLRTPQRLDSVVVPTVASVYSSPTKPNGKEPPMKFGPPKKASKATAAAAESDAPRVSKTKKPARPPSTSESAPSSPPPPPATRSTRRTLPANAEAGPSRASTSTSPSKLARTPSKRSAATKATQKLHDVIMPDLVSFQKEMKKGAVRPAYERDQQELLKSASKGKTPLMKGRKRPSMGSAAEDEDDEEVEEDDMPERKKRKTSEVEETERGKGKKKAGPRRSTVESEEPDVVSSKKKGSAAATNGSATETKVVRMMTTQVALSDSVAKALGHLGVKIVTKPADCTHLLVRSVVRTEKFLCAMAVAPHILSVKWAEMSAANRKLLPETLYEIKDEETEKKYSFSLADALKRAKQNAGKLFAGVTFYVTPKVPVDTKLLKNVVSANGGQISTQSPTVRILSQHNRFVISSAEDVSIWRPLVEHNHKIYTQELILTSALRQEVHWDDDSFLVPGTY